MSMENRARSQGKGTFEGKASRLPSNKLRESGHKTMKKRNQTRIESKGLEKPELTRRQIKPFIIFEASDMGGDRATKSSSIV